MGKSYGKSVDLFLYGLLAYEMLTGEQAFPFLDDNDEHVERIKKAQFFFPDEPGFIEMYKTAGVPLPSADDGGIKLDFVEDEDEPPIYREVPDKSKPHVVSAEAKDMVR